MDPCFLQQTHKQNHTSFNYSFQWDGQPFKIDSGFYIFFWRSSWVIIFVNVMYLIVLLRLAVRATQWNYKSTKNKNDSQRQKIVKKLLGKIPPSTSRKAGLGVGSVLENICCLRRWTWIQMSSTLIKRLCITMQAFKSGSGGEGVQRQEDPWGVLTVSLAFKVTSRFNEWPVPRE